jgi:hypothetical protein
MTCGSNTIRYFISRSIYVIQHYLNISRHIVQRGLRVWSLFWGLQFILPFSPTPRDSATTSKFKFQIRGNQFHDVKSVFRRRSTNSLSLWNQKIHYHIHKTPQLNPILGHFSPQTGPHHTTSQLDPTLGHFSPQTSPHHKTPRSGPSAMGLVTIFYCLRFETSFSSPPTARRATVEVFESSSTRDSASWSRLASFYNLPRNV